MLLDIIITFLLAYQEEGQIEYTTDYYKIAVRYIKEGTFYKDFITWLPIYAVLSWISPSLEIFSLLKSTRIFQLFDTIEKKRVVPLIRSQFKENSRKVLEDPKKREDSITDHNHVVL